MAAVITGRLDRKILIEQPVEVQDTFGTLATTGWTTFHIAWAEKQPLRGLEKLAADQRRYSAASIWTIRYLDGVTTKMRIVDEYGIKYRITSVKEVGRRHGLEIEAEIMQGGSES